MKKIIKIEILLQKGYMLFQKEDYNGSIDKYNKALLLDKTYSKTLYLLGLAHGSISKHLEAKNFFYKSLKNDPDNHYIYYNLAKALSELNLDFESLKYHKKAIDLNSNSFESWLNYGISFKKIKDFNSAIECFKKTINLNSNDSRSFSQLGEIYIDIKDYNKALEYFERSLSINPLSSETMTNIGIVYKNIKNFDKSLSYHLNAVKINSNNAEAYSNLGTTYRGMFKFKDALKSLTKAIEIKPNLDSAWTNKGLVYTDIDNYKKAKLCYKKAIKLNHKNADALFNLSLLELANRNFQKGWIFYEKRWNTKKFQKYITTSKKQWDGLSKQNSILIVSEQGLGDQILYGSMFNEIKKFSDKIYLLCDSKLTCLFKRSFPDYNIISRKDFNNEKSMEDYETHIAMGSLGQFFRNEINDFKKFSKPYLIDNKNLTLNLKNKVKEKNKIVCGITWYSNNEDIGENKSINLNLLSSILQNKKLKIINLQYGDVNHLIKNYNTKNKNKIVTIPEIDLTNDIDGSVSLIQNCDFVLTISNTTAHLAASIGKDVVLMIPKNIGKLYYWSSNSDYSLWYPSVRIFKQENNLNWEKTINEINQYIIKKYLSSL